ncbi:hypothetical protein ACSTJQ_08580 [Vibrio parahaemolyticus]
MYSLVEMVNANGLVSVEYRTYCFERLAVAPITLEVLVPWNIKGLKSDK